MEIITKVDYCDRAAVIAAIKKNLEARSGKRWSVTGGTGTAYGWLRIDAPPARRTWQWRRDAADELEEYDERERGGHTGPADRAELAELLGLPEIHHQGHSIPASSEYRAEYVARSTGEIPTTYGTQYWD